MNVLDQTATIQAFLSATAARQPTPGGGGVTALAGALAAALGEMVLNYSLGKKELAAHQAQLTDALAELTRARQLLLGLMAEDQAAFAALSAAKKLPDGQQQQLGAKQALRICLDIPRAVAATGLALLELFDRIAVKTNKHLLSDLAIAADLAMATVRCSIHNIRVNLADLDDPAERANFERDNQQMLARGLAAIIQFSRKSL